MNTNTLTKPYLQTLSLFLANSFEWSPIQVRTIMPPLISPVLCCLVIEGVYCQAALCPLFSQCFSGSTDTHAHTCMIVYPPPLSLSLSSCCLSQPRTAWLWLCIQPAMRWSCSVSVWPAFHCVWSRCHFTLH